jgi:lysophospholipase L1-like esterase
MKKYTLWIVVSLEILIIVSVCFYIAYKKRSYILSVSPVSRKNLVVPVLSDLKYYYESAPNTNDSNGIPAWLKEAVTYPINADGLHDRFNYTAIKPDDTFRIITLGDSFTYGLFVNLEQNWTELLEDKLNKNLQCKIPKKIEVINLGMQGYDIRYAVERFKLHGQKYNPDMIIWFIKQDDINEINELFLPRINAYVQKLGRGRIEPQDVNVWQIVLDQVKKELGGNEKFIEYQKNAFENLNNYFTKKLVIYAPAEFLLSENIDPVPVLQSFAEQRKNTDLYQSQLVLGKANLLYPDYHPNPDGHKAIAQDIFDYLKSNNEIPCQK